MITGGACTRWTVYQQVAARKDEEILQHRVPLSPDQNSEDHNGNRLARFAHDLRRVVDPHERLVARHHGREVGEGADGVVRRLRGVLAGLSQNVAGRDDGVEVVHDTLNKDEGKRVSEALLGASLAILPPSSEKILRNVSPL